MKNLFLSGYKTFGTGLFGLVYAGSQLLGHPVPGLPEMTPEISMQTVIGSLLAIFLRLGIAKAGK